MSVSRIAVRLDCVVVRQPVCARRLSAREIAHQGDVHRRPVENAQVWLTSAMVSAATAIIPSLLMDLTSRWMTSC